MSSARCRNLAAGHARISELNKKGGRSEGRPLTHQYFRASDLPVNSLLGRLSFIRSLLEDKTDLSMRREAPRDVRHSGQDECIQIRANEPSAE
jgi:hypothetical protein